MNAPDISVDAPAIIGLQKVSEYDPDRLLVAMRSCLEPLGGMKAFVRPGQRVLLKPNLIGGFPPERAATTHPAVVRAAILLVQEAGGLALVGDSPGMGDLPSAIQGSGLAPVLESTGAQLLDFSEPHEFEAPANVVARRLTLAKALLDIDVIISLPKLKTHGIMRFTGALKNQFGLIPGALKSQWHFRLQQPEWLASLILDVNRIAWPALAIMDAVVAMEGPGPTSGKPRYLGVLMASRDLAAVDTLACHLIGLNPMHVPLLAAARAQGCGQTDLEQLRVAGDDWQQIRVPDFERVEDPADVLQLLPLPKAALQWIRRQWTRRPRIIDGRCTVCGICEKGCPVSPSAIHPDAPPDQRVDDQRCIRCYCCHEFCPSQGIELYQPWLARHVPLTAIANKVNRLVSFLATRGRRR